MSVHKDMRVPCMHMARINVRVKVIFSVTVRVYNMAGYGHVHKLSKQASIFIRGVIRLSVN